MAPHVLTLAQIRALLFEVVSEITSLTGAGQIRHAFPPNGQPAWKITDDVICIHLEPVDHPFDKDRHYLEDTSDPDYADIQVFYTRVLAATFYLYGPNSFDLADTLRHGILMETYRSILAAEQIYPVPLIGPARRVPYLFAGQWWDRQDLTVTFNVGTQRAVEVPYIESANIEIHTEAGLQRTVIVTPLEE